MNIVQPPAPPLPSELVARFRKVVGDKYAVTDQADIAPYVTEERDLFRGRSPLVLRPGSTAEVAAICKLATEHGIALVPQGGNTGLVGGQTPHNGEVVVSMRRLDKIRDIDTASNTMTCEAGVVLQIAQQCAAEADRLFPLSLGAEGSCTIGGNLSTNAGGTTALAYGVAREMALGLEVVLADGRVLNGLSKLKKDNTGYDLRNLFIGAEGTLGIITAATLKLFPKPRAVETAFVGLQSPAQALKLLSISQNEAAGSLTSFELLSDIAVDFSIRHGIDIRNPLSGEQLCPIDVRLRWIEQPCIKLSRRHLLCDAASCCDEHLVRNPRRLGHIDGETDCGKDVQVVALARNKHPITVFDRPERNSCRE